MSSSKLILTLILSIVILLNIQTAITANPLYSICSSSSGNFSDYSPYQTKLNKLLTILYVKAPSTGFALHTIKPLYNSVDQVNGLALCRGDVNSSVGQSCIAQANNDIRVLCPNNKAGIIWYDSCLLKYSDNEFLGRVDKVNEFKLVNVNTVKDVEPSVFNRETRELLTELAVQASANSTKFFAGGETEVFGKTSYDNSMKVYGMVQCTRDLSTSGCKTCLDEAIAEIPNCCGGKQGARVVGGSCNVQYEIYPFLNIA